LNIILRLFKVCNTYILYREIDIDIEINIKIDIEIDVDIEIDMNIEIDMYINILEKM